MRPTAINPVYHGAMNRVRSGNQNPISISFRGLTVVEIIVGLSLLILVSASAWHFLLSIHSSDATLRGRDETAQTAFRLVNHLRADLRGGQLRQEGKGIIHIETQRLDEAGNPQPAMVSYMTAGMTIRRVQGGSESIFQFRTAPAGQPWLEFSLDTHPVGFRLHLRISDTDSANGRVLVDEFIPGH